MNNFNLNRNCLGPQIKMRKVHIYEKKNPTNITLKISRCYRIVNIRCVQNVVEALQRCEFYCPFCNTVTS